MSDVILVCTLDPGHALLLVNQLANILVYKLPLGSEEGLVTQSRPAGRPLTVPGLPTLLAEGSAASYLLLRPSSHPMLTEGTGFTGTDSPRAMLYSTPF